MLPWHWRRAGPAAAARMPTTHRPTAFRTADEDPAMYVCLCNGITDGQVRDAAAAGAQRPKEVFAACGCGARCAACTREMLSLLRQGTAMRGA